VPTFSVVMLAHVTSCVTFLQPMRTESGADDSWENKAEKEDAFTPPLVPNK
jgi:hypothetical protein